MRRRSFPIPTKTRRSPSSPCPGRLRSICWSRGRRGNCSRMVRNEPTRRAILKSLTIGAAAGSVLRVIPLQAAEYAHHLIEDEKSTGPAYTPKFFDAPQYKALQALWETIIPPDADS